MQLGNIIKIARVQFLVLGLALFVFGALVAVSFGAAFSWDRFLLGCTIVLAAQLSVHFSNDYYDVDSDRAGGTTLISGGAGVLLDHPELRQTSLRIAIGLTLFSLTLAGIFVLIYDYSLWYFGLAVLGNLSGWVYSAPPFRWCERGLGEWCSVFVIGFLVPVTGYATLAGTVDAGILMFLIPVLFYGLVLILTVEMPDREDDLQAGKRNWIVRYGRRFGFTLIGLSLLAATAYFFFFPPFAPQPVPFDIAVIGWLSLLTLLPGIWGLVQRPAERTPATRIATVQILSLAVFTILVDGYLWIALWNG